jgi:amidase
MAISKTEAAQPPSSPKLALPFQSATELASAVRGKRISARELLELYLKRVESYNGAINAIIVTDFDGARARADALDAVLQAGNAVGPLHGVPMTIKESFDVVGMPTTWGIPELAHHRAESNALVVDRLLAAGANLFGKTNVPLYLGDWQTFNAIYGVTNNPWDLKRSPGGSSGGAAAALAAGLTGIETGSDIGASIRNPAHYCGVFGHKPTWGICPQRGHALPGVVADADINVVGPLARSAGDLDLALSVMAGPDEIDARGLRLELPAAAKTSFRELKLAVILNDANAEVDLEVQERIQAVAEFLARRGATVSDRARPQIDTNELARNYILLLRAATAGRQTPAMFEQNARIARELGPDDDSYFARMMRGFVVSHRDWLQLNNERHKMRLRWAQFFRDYDLLLCPAAATAALPHDHAGERYQRTIPVNGKRVPTTDQLFWAGYSCVAFLPASVAPAGFTRSGLPVGVQIVGAQYQDRQCIQLARMLEAEFQPFVPPRGYD